jgi:diguanylate cyclase (GGDEF)-like protein/PAS domain S-box-containing protein
MLWSVGAESDQIIYVSPASRELFGHEPEEFLSKRGLWLEIVHAEDRTRVLEARQRLRQGQPFEIEYRVVRPDGQIRWINDRGRQIHRANGSVERIDGLARDVTEQVGHRRRIARLSRVREFASAINSALVRLRSRDELFAEICRIAVQVGGFAGAHVGLLEASTLEVRWTATSGTGARWKTGTGSGVSAREDHESGHGVIGRSLRTKRAALWNDVAQDAGVRDREVLLQSGIRALGSFPLLIDEGAVGVVCLDAREAGFFDSDEMRLLEELTANIAFALELMAKQERISYLALYDTLTGLPNRMLFQERLTPSIESARLENERLALVLIDLERFKAINDTLGQHTGDHVLQAVAQRLREWEGGVEGVARLGSNLFAIRLHAVSGAEDIARRFDQAAARFLGAPFQIDGHEVRLAAKAGIAIFPDDGPDAGILFRNAEAALKRAKETGERYLFYAPSINARISEQVELEHRLRKAVEHREFFLHFQPKLDLATRRIVGLEALMRWHGPDGALVSPAVFIPVLEQTGLILEAGQQVLAAAKQAYADWSAAGLNPPRIAVNVSALQLRRRSFVEDVRAALGSVGSDAGGVDLEITESLLMSDVDESIGKLLEVRRMGMRIALDDFGTGYSSLAYLSKLPLDALKIDRGFVRGMTENAGDTSIVSTIISLGQSLRLKVVAEGVETEEQAELLRLLRCDQAQGFLFSRPVPAEEIRALLSSISGGPAA